MLATVEYDAGKDLAALAAAAPKRKEGSTLGNHSPLVYVSLGLTNCR